TPPVRWPARLLRGEWPLLAGCVVLGLVVLAAVWVYQSGRLPWGSGRTQADVADPRLTFPTPYRNVRPEVKYVGDQACADCHREQFASYREPPMGRSLAPVAAAPPGERYDLAAFNPFVASGLHYGIDRRDDRVFHHEWAEAGDGKVLTE